VLIYNITHSHTESLVTRSPGCSTYDIDYMILSVRCLQMLCSTDKVTFILGDFNLPDIDWSYYHAPDNIIHNTFLNFVNSYGLTQFVKQSTRDNNILGLVLSTSNKIISNIDILPPIGTSDHNVIVFDINLVNSINEYNSSDHSFLDWSRADYDMISMDLCSVDWNNAFQYCLFLSILRTVGPYLLTF